MNRRKAYSIKADIVVYAETSDAALVALARHFAWMCRPITVGTRESGNHRMGGKVEIEITDEQRANGLTVEFGARLFREGDEKSS